MLTVFLKKTSENCFETVEFTLPSPNKSLVLLGKMHII
jgi:hypothetical protein